MVLEVGEAGLEQPSGQICVQISVAIHVGPLGRWIALHHTESKNPRSY
jgi:hypothetical protein